MRTSKAAVATILFLGIQLGMAESRQVTVCMDAGLFFAPIEHRARYEATRIFAAIDVELRWAGRRQCPEGAIQILQSPTPPP